MGHENEANIHHEDYSAVRKNETMTISEKLMDLVNILDKETQTQKDRHPMFLISDVSIWPRASKESRKDQRSCEGGRLGRGHKDGGEYKGEIGGNGGSFSWGRGWIRTTQRKRKWRIKNIKSVWNTHRESFYICLKLHMIYTNVWMCVCVWTHTIFKNRT